MRIKNLFENLERTGESKSAVVGWGRGMGHKGHMFLASSVVTHAEELSADPYFVVSKTVGKDDPITPEEKLEIYKKVFPEKGHIFQTATDEMPDLTRVLSKLNNLGYDSVTVVVGADQKKALSYVKNYNGTPDKKGNIPYSFKELNVISRQETNDPNAGEEGPRATPMRDILKDPKASEDEKFNLWRSAMSPELSDDEVKDLMHKASQRMGEFTGKKDSVTESVSPDQFKKTMLSEVRAIMTEMRNDPEISLLLEHTIIESKKRKHGKKARVIREGDWDQQSDEMIPPEYDMDPSELSSLRNAHTIDDEKIQQMIGLAAKGIKDDQIADIFKIDKETVAGILDDHIEEIEAAMDPEDGMTETARLSTREKFKRSLKRAGYDPDAGAKRIEDLLAKQKKEREERERKEQEQGVAETKQPEAPKPRNFVAKNAKTAGAGAHKDAKKASKEIRGQKHKAKLPLDESKWGPAMKFYAKKNMP